ncbi:MAG: RNA-binding protein [Mycobacterium sp.]
MSRTTGRAALCAAALLLSSAAAVISAPVSGAVCGSIGGPRIDVSGCADPLYEMNYLPPPPPPPPPGYIPPPPPPPVYVPPPPPLPNVNVCANVGRRISVSGCI